MDRRGFFKSLVAGAVGLFVLPKNDTNKTKPSVNSALSGKRRSGTNFIFAEPDPDMIIVSTTVWNGRICVATQKGVYRIDDDDKLVRLELIIKEKPNAK